MLECETMKGSFNAFLTPNQSVKSGPLKFNTRVAVYAIIKDPTNLFPTKKQIKLQKLATWMKK